MPGLRREQGPLTHGAPARHRPAPPSVSRRSRRAR
jgi:hypothetical protein